MGNFPNKETQFSADNQPERNGRPRKWVCELRDKGYRLSEVNDAIQVLIQMSKDELKEVSEGEDNAMIERIVAAALLQSYTKKSLYNIETLLTRVYGKPKELTEATGTQKIIVEYVNPTDKPVSPAPGTADGT